MKAIEKMISANLPQKYCRKQVHDIARYGERFVPRYKSVTEEILEEFTPFRRLSNKSSNLSDNDWFIKNFEKQSGTEFLPVGWEKMSEKDKANHIVRERYSSLVANKIMNKIKDEATEHSYSLRQGDIINYSHGDKTSVTAEKYFADTDIHNHPVGIVLKQDSTPDEIKLYQIISPNIFECKVPHSGKDIFGATIKGRKSYVIDSNGNKFLYSPKTRSSKNLEETILTANGIKTKMEEKDKEIQRRYLSIWGDLFIKTAKEATGLSNEKIVDSAVKYYNDKVYSLALPFIGLYRSLLLKSDIIKNIGKFKELGK